MLYLQLILYVHFLFKIGFCKRSMYEAPLLDLFIFIRLHCLFAIRLRNTVYLKVLLCDQFPNFL